MTNSTWNKLGPLILGLILALHLGSHPAALAGSKKYDEDIEVLRARLAQHPEDVDTRLQLATVLSWRGDRTLARQQASRVIAQAPQYWDAHLLVARLDAWDGHYDKARQRIRQILKVDPEHLPASMLLADVEIWAHHLDEAERILLRLLARQKSADIYYRLARVAMLRRNSLRAYLLTRKALGLNPVDKDVLDYQQQIVLVSTDLAYQFEVIIGEEVLPAHSEILTVAFIPRAFLSLVLLHELHYRFETINNRMMLQADWRITKDITLSVLGGFAYPAHVIPQGTGHLRLSVPILSRWDAAIGYTYDYLPLPSQLHRIRLDNGFSLPHDLRLEVGYIAGILVEKDVGDLHGVHLRLYWKPSWIEIYLQYAYGMELYYPTPYYARWNDFKELRANAVGFQIMGNIGRRFTLRGGYDFELRSNETQAHLVHVAGRLWF